MKIGKIAIVGKSNVGKSTLINQIFDKEIVIATSKPQTTRNRIELLYQKDDCQIIFSDTPGFHKPRNKLDLFLNSQVKKALKNVDIILFVCDVKSGLDNDDIDVLNQIKTFKYEKLILLINKCDNEDASAIEQLKDQLYNIIEFDKCFCISALYNQNINDVLNYIKRNLNDSDTPLVTDPSEIEQQEKFVIAEIIRKVILNEFRYEVPHATAIVVDEMKYDPEKNLLDILFSIIVEKESQKPIIIGKRGESIKKIGVIARKELSKIYDCKMYLKSFVKVRKNWRDDNNIIKELGYKK